MKINVELGEENFYQWIKLQLEKRCVFQKMRLDKNALREELNVILFQE